MQEGDVKQLTIQQSSSFSKFYSAISQVKDSECPHQIKSQYVWQNGVTNVKYLSADANLISVRYLPRQDH